MLNFERWKLLSLLFLSLCCMSTIDGDEQADGDDISDEQIMNMAGVLQTIKQSGLLSDEDMTTLNAAMEIANIDFNEFSEKTEQLEKMKAEYQQKLQGMQQLHSQMKETETQMAAERQQFEQMQQHFAQVQNDLKNCLSDVRDGDKERQNWEEQTSRFAMDLKLADDMIQDEKKKLKKCEKEATTREKTLTEKHSQEIKDLQTKLDKATKKMTKLKEEKLNLLEKLATDTTTLYEESLEEVKQKMQNEFNSERQKYIDQISDLYAKLDGDEDKLDFTYDAVLRRKTEHIEFLKVENVRLQDARIDTESKWMKTVKEMKEENMKLERVGPSANLVESLQLEVEKLSDKVQSCTVTKDTLEERYAELKEINSGTARSVTHWNQKYIQCNQNITKLTQQIDDLQTQVKNITDYSDNMKAYYLTNSKHYSEEMKRLQGNKSEGVGCEEVEEQLTKEKKEVWMRDRKIQSLKAYLDKCNGELDDEIKSTKDLQKKQDENEVELKKVVDERDEARKFEASARASCKKSLTEKNELLQKNKLDYDALEDKYSECVKESSSKQVSSKDTTKLDRQIAEMTLTIKELERENKATYERMAVYQTKSKECITSENVCNTKLKNMQKSLDTRDAAIKLISYNCSTLDNCRFDLEMVTKHYNKSLIDCKCEPVMETDEYGDEQIVGFKSLYNCDEKTESLNQNLKETDAKYGDCQLGRAKLEGEILESKSKQTELEKQLKELKATKEKSDREIGDSANIKSLQDSYDNCEATLRIVRDKLQSSEEKNRKFEDQLSDQKEIEKRLDECGVIEAQLKYSQSAFKSKLEEKEMENAMKNQQLQKAEIAMTDCWKAAKSQDELLWIYISGSVVGTALILFFIYYIAIRDKKAVTSETKPSQVNAKKTKKESKKRR